MCCSELPWSTVGESVAQVEISLEVGSLVHSMLEACLLSDDSFPSGFLFSYEQAHYLIFLETFLFHHLRE